MLCQKCRIENADTAKFCVKCGTKMATAEAQAAAALQAGDPTRAVSVLTPHLEGHPDDAAAWRLKMAAHASLGQWEMAWDAAVRTVRLCRRDPDAYCDLAAVLHRLGRMSEAKQAIQRALSLDPKNLRATAFVAEMGECVMSEPKASLSDKHGSSDTAQPPPPSSEVSDLELEGAADEDCPGSVSTPPPLPDDASDAANAFDCPLCHHRIVVSNHHFMTNIRCRNCREFVDIPTSATSRTPIQDVEVADLPSGVTDSGYTTMDGMPQYECAVCGTRLMEPFPRRCPECHLVLGAPLYAEEETAPVVPLEPQPIPAPPEETMPIAVSPVIPPPKPWYRSAKGVLNWCLGRDGDAGPGFVEIGERDEQGQIRFECATCQTMLPPKMPDECPHCGRTFALTAPRVRSIPAPSPVVPPPAAPREGMPETRTAAVPEAPSSSPTGVATPPALSAPAAPPTQTSAAVPAGVREVPDATGSAAFECANCGWPLDAPAFPERCSYCGRRLDGQMPTRRRRFRVRWTHAAAAAVTIVVVLLIANFAMGLPLRATKAAFAELKAIDQGGMGTMRPELVVDACPDDSTATKERLKQLSRVLWDLNTEGRAGGWVASGRLLKYASALGTPPTETQAALASLRQRMNTDGELTEKTERAIGALRTIGKRYSTWPLRQRAIEALAGDLGIEPDEGKLWAEVESRHAQIVAQEEADKAARIAAERQARQTETAARRPRFYIFEGRAYYPGQEAQLQAAMAASDRFRQKVARNQAEQNARDEAGGRNPLVQVPMGGGGGSGGSAGTGRAEELEAQAKAAEIVAVQYARQTGYATRFGNAMGLWAAAGNAYVQAGRMQDYARAAQGYARCSDYSVRPWMSNAEARETLGGLP